MVSIVAALFLAVACGEAWEDVWIHTKLSDAQKTNAIAAMEATHDMADIKTCRAEGLKGWSFVTSNNVKKKEKKVSYKDMPQYKAIEWNNEDSDRYKPLCKVFFDPVVISAKTSKGSLKGGKAARSSCTCSYVGPDLVLTAGHCLSDIVSIEAQVVYVIQRYGMEAPNEEAHLTHRRKNARAAIEWWIPKLWVDNEKSHEAWKSDVAFIRVHKPAEDPVYYQMMTVRQTPGGSKQPLYDMTDKKIIALGYPGNFLGSETAINVKGKLKGGRAENLELKQDLTRVHTCKLLGGLIKIPIPKDVRGPMGQGGSGGPWILNPDSWKGIKDVGLVKTLRMGVFSVTSFGEGSLFQGWTPPENFEGLQFTPRLIEAVAMINKFDSELVKARTTTVSTVRNVAEVKFQLRQPEEGQCKMALEDAPESAE